MKKFSRILFAAILGICLIISAFQSYFAQEQTLSYLQIINALNAPVPNSSFKNKFEVVDFIIKKVNFLGVEGELTLEIEKSLWLAGATDQLMKAIKVKASNFSKSTKTFSKSYQEMSEAEKNEFIEYKTNEFLDKFGRTEAEKLSIKSVESIKVFVEGYVKRLSIKEKSGDLNIKNDCLFARSNLTDVFKRGTNYSLSITESFRSKGIQPEVGIYIAFIESEFCPCLQAPTGPLGMFQLTASTAGLYGIKAVRGASSKSPDERCEPKKAANASADYIKMLTDKFYGRDANGALFSIAAFNSGEGGLNKNISTLRQINGSTKITFWDLVENKDKLSNQFQVENSKYVPKFLAAVIIGENPKSFGLVEFQPLTSLKDK